ncbi:hypothetical protein L6452_32846 [Arctium lappa]|uniref:Uncharacterized protein n=1 Tax=Arctium lappa TaxID=4217 RepID=A0ACB8Z5S8_ARCLA|nr:hypothetical protein L6452_32846 [Arctium lappa]
MMLFLEGVDLTISEYVANGPYEPFIIIVAVPATATTPAIPERYPPKEIRQWSDEDKNKVGLDAKAKTIISMAFPDEAFHYMMHLKTSKEMSKKVFRPSSCKKTSDNKYLKLNEKYVKLKSYKRKGKGLIAEEHDWAESEESSSDEEDAANLCLMADIKEEVEESSGSTTTFISSQVSISTNPSLPESERCHVVDVLTIDLYNALNGKTLADQVIVNEIISIEREQAIAALKAEKAIIEGWCKSSTKITDLISAQIPAHDKTGIGYRSNKDESSKDCSMLKFGMFVSSIPDTSSSQRSSSSNPIPKDLSKSSRLADKGKSIFRNSKKATEVETLKKTPSKPSADQPSSSGSKITDN